MSTLKQKMEERANIWSQMTPLLDDESGEARSKYDALENDLESLSEEIERLQRHADHASKMDKVDRSDLNALQDQAPTPASGEDYERAFSTWMKRGAGDLTGDERKVLQRGFQPGNELRALGVATNSAGGYLVPPQFRARVVEVMQYIAAMRQYAEVITTDSGAPLPWPTNDDTANEGAILGENTQASEQDVVFNTATIGAFMYTSKLTRVSFQLLQDSAFDLEAWLARTLGTRIGRVQNRHFTVGTGTNQPTGLVTGAPVGKTGATGQTTSVTYDDLVDLTDSIDPAYTGNMRWMMSQTSRKLIRKLKDTQNRPLWEPSLQINMPDQLLGYGMVLNNNVPVPAANAKSILFGDFNSAYLIRDVSEFQLIRLAERFADYAQVGFIGFQRSDGQVQNPSAVRAYQHSAT